MDMGVSGSFSALKSSLGGVSRRRPGSRRNIKGQDLGVCHPLCGALTV